MFKVFTNEEIAPKVYRMVVEAPRIASARKPGQFVIVREKEGAERIPLTIADADRDKGTITLIIQAVGAGTIGIVSVKQGGAILDVAGPLGHETEIRNWGHAVCIGGGVGTAVLFPLAKALAEAGNRVTTILGGRSASFVILKEELSRFSNEVLVATDDGSLGMKGLVTDVLETFLKESKAPDVVFAVGPLPMMSAVAEKTRPYKIKTIVSLNPIMVDGTGMCGGCRVTVGGETRFACVDGPEFDGHQVDFKELASRSRTYQEHVCRLKGI